MNCRARPHGDSSALPDNGRDTPLVVRATSPLIGRHEGAPALAVCKQVHAFVIGVVMCTSIGLWSARFPIPCHDPVAVTHAALVDVLLAGSSRQFRADLFDDIWRDVATDRGFEGGNVLDAFTFLALLSDDPLYLGV